LAIRARPFPFDRLKLDLSYSWLGYCLKDLARAEFVCVSDDLRKQKNLWAVETPLEKLKPKTNIGRVKRRSTPLESNFDAPKNPSARLKYWSYK